MMTQPDPHRRPMGHPFRARMPRAPAVPIVQRDDSDLKLFAVSFTAFFICFYTFLL